ncbi:MAG: hypothetical protein K0Q68_548 [Moraxellaceae bacterium]|jgi:hypothetical protein|nr:hypothetical protein [Moraxellaceae bacterium]
MAGNLSRPALQDRVFWVAPGATGAPEGVEVEAGHDQGRAKALPLPDLTMIKSGLAGMP